MKVLNLDVVDIPESYIPIDGIFLIKCLDGAGDTVVCARYTAGLDPWEKIGILEAESTIAKNKVLRQTVDIT